MATEPPPTSDDSDASTPSARTLPEVRVRRIHRRDLNRSWVEHLARVRGCTHLVLEVAENNENALKFYRTRSFYRLDAAIFLAKKISSEAELLPPRRLKRAPPKEMVEAIKAATAAAPPPRRKKAPTNGKP